MIENVARQRSAGCRVTLREDRSQGVIIDADVRRDEYTIRFEDRVISAQPWHAFDVDHSDWQALRETVRAKAAVDKRVEDWCNCIAARNVTRLTHVTRMPNLPSILERGLFPVTDFRELPEQPLRNDEERYDRRLDRVSLSVTHPNDALFWRWHSHKYPGDTWVVLAIDPAVLWELRCSIFFSNAASGGGRTAVTESEQPLAADFEMLFTELPDGPTRAQLGHGPEDTTDPQAEVMIRAKIAPTYIRRIGVRSRVDFERVRQIIGDGKQNVPLTIEPWLFDMRRCASEFRKASLARQQVILPAANQHIDFFDDDLAF